MQTLTEDFLNWGLAEVGFSNCPLESFMYCIYDHRNAACNWGLAEVGISNCPLESILYVSMITKMQHVTGAFLNWGFPAAL